MVFHFTIGSAFGDFARKSIVLVQPIRPITRGLSFPGRCHHSGANGGYYLFECASIDDALDWAARIPGAQHGSIEVRPVYSDPRNMAADR